MVIVGRGKGLVFLMVVWDFIFVMGFYVGRGVEGYYGIVFYGGRYGFRFFVNIIFFNFYDKFIS